VAGVLTGLLAVLLAGLVGTATPAQAAPWTGSTTRTATVTAATLGSAFTLAAGTTSGTVSAGGSQFAVSSVLSTVTGYANLTNTSNVAAAPSLTVTMGNLVGTTPAAVCSQPWDVVAGTCPGTTTTIGLTVLLGNQTGTYTAPAPLPQGGAVYLRVQTNGVAGAITLTTNPVVPRAPADRTSA
jgi:hypothetical protein